MEPKKISENVTLYSADPIVYVVNDFLSEDECNAFVELGKGKMERATVITTLKMKYMPVEQMIIVG